MEIIEDVVNDLEISKECINYMIKKFNMIKKINYTKQFICE